MTRIRTQTKWGSCLRQTWYKINGKWEMFSDSPTHVIGISRCEDVSDNPGGNNPLRIYHRSDNQEGITGYLYYSADGDGIRHPYQYRESMPNGWGLHACVEPDIPSPPGVTLAARMSPAKPSVDLPLFLFELKDVKGMHDEIMSFGKSLGKSVELIRHALLSKLSDPGYRPQFSSQSKGGLNLRDVDWNKLTKESAERLGGFNLSYGFGWAPLVSDILTLTGFAENFERRRKQLENLYRPDNKGLRRRINIGSISETWHFDPQYLGSTDGYSFSGSSTYIRTSRKWATSRWKPTPWTSPPPEQTSEWLDWKTTSNLLGLNVSLDTLWNAIPFTWAADYFSNIGDFLELSRNASEMYCEGISVMQNTVETRTLTITERNWEGTGGGGTSVAELKTRTPATVFELPTFTPFLALGQVSNLASLSVAKRTAWRN